MAGTTTAALLSILVAATDLGQQSTNVQLFASPRFNGQPLELAGPTTKLGAITVKSIRLPVGASWDLCSGNTFTGCKRFTASKLDMVFVVRSARPVEAAIEGIAAPTAASVHKGSDGPTLRGVTSQFYVEPAQNGERVGANDEVAGGEAAAALQFCQAHGWRQAAYERVQIAEKRRLLADVLCVNDDLPVQR